MYDRKVGAKELTFGVSGRLYQSNVLLYDKETESLWSQLKEEAVTGEMTGTKLPALPSVVTPWGRWKNLHPTTLVLSPDTGYSRPYQRNPYEDYERSSDVMFPPSRIDSRLPAKERVLGLEVAEKVIAFPFRRLERAKGPVELRFGNVRVEIRYDRATETAEALVDGKPASAFTGYWFAWYGFHPKTEIWGDVEPKASSSARDFEIAIVAHEGRWSDLTGMGPAGGLDGVDEAGSFYLIHGTLRNDSRQPIAYVELRYELLNDQGEVVFREHGYNRGAEILRDEEFESGRKSPRETTIEPIPPAATETFRMFFFRDELPPFRSYRVFVANAGKP